MHTLHMLTIIYAWLKIPLAQLIESVYNIKLLKPASSSELLYYANMLQHL